MEVVRFDGFNKGISRTEKIKNFFFCFSDSGGDANSNYGNVTRPYSMQPSPSHPMHGDVQNGASDENWRSHGEGRVGK